MPLVYKMNIFAFFITAVICSPYYLGEGYQGPKIGRVKNLTEITGKVTVEF